MVELYPHNQKAVDAVREAFASGKKKAAVVHATGTGKSLISATVADDYKRVLVLAPNNFVLNETRKWCGSHVEFRTYSSNLYNPIGEYDLIIFDEFHRAGAPQWGEGVKTLIAKNKEANLLGLSATHIRYLDNERNMVDELFESNIVSKLILPDAIKQGILPDPTYVSSIYDIEKDFNSLKNRITQSKKLKGKNKEADIYKLVKITENWQNAHGVPTIIRKYFNRYMKRVIVFTSQVGQFEETRTMLSNWFTSAGYNHIDYYQINYANPFVEKEMARFQDDSAFTRANNPVDLKVAISVDMLNEGVHIPRVDGIIMLRGTISRIIIEQQVGRCLTSNNSGIIPVVLDLVNNMDSIRYGNYEFSGGKQEKKTKEKKSKKDAFPFKVIDECRDIRIFYQQLENEYIIERTDFTIKERIAMVRDYVDEFGRQPPKSVRNAPKDVKDVSNSYSRLRYMYNHGLLDEDDAIEFEKILDIVDIFLEDRLDAVIEYCKQNNKVPSPSNKELYNAYALARGKKKHNTIKPNELAKYEEAMSYIKDLKWEKYRPLLEDYYNEHGSLPTSGCALYRFLCSMRVRANLSEERRCWLEAHGFRFELTNKVDINQSYEEVLAYLEAHDYIVPNGKEEKRIMYKISDFRKFALGRREFPKTATEELREKIQVLIGKCIFPHDINRRLDEIEKIFFEKGRIDGNSLERAWLNSTLRRRKGVTDEQKERIMRLLQRKNIVVSKTIENSVLVAWIKERGHLPEGSEDRRMYNSLMKFRKCKNGRYQAVEKDPETYAFLQSYGFDCHAQKRDTRPLEVRLQEIMDRVKANGCLDDNARNVYYSAKDRHEEDQRYQEFFKAIESKLDKSKSNKERVWTPEEDAIIIQFFKDNNNPFFYVNRLKPLLPNREINSINQRVARLKKRNVIC